MFLSLRALTKDFKSRTGKRFLPILALLLAALACGFPTFLCGLYWVFAPPHTDIVVLGVDSRPGEGWMARADSIILVGIEPRRFAVTLMSIPRDLSIDVPGFGLQRVNTVNMLGEMEAVGTGPELMKAGIRQSFGVQPERYVRLDFNGFTHLIDAVGGVTIDVPSALVDHAYPTEDDGVMTVEFAAGLQHMDGKRALIYARTRHADDDYRRAERQQQVISALLGKLINPIYWPAVAAALAQTVDTDLTLWDLVVLAPPVLIGGARAERLVINREYITATAEGVAIPDYIKIAPWLEAYFD